MPRLARTVSVGFAHHITTRGNNRQAVFFVDDDRRVFLDLLAEKSERLDLVVDGCCLMTNHVHLIVTPEHQDSLAGFGLYRAQSRAGTFVHQSRAAVRQ